MGGLFGGGGGGGKEYVAPPAPLPPSYTYDYGWSLHGKGAGATQNISYGTCEKSRLISFEGSICFSLVTLKLTNSKDLISGRETSVTLPG